MNTEQPELKNISEKKDFLVRSSSLKDVRTFSREVFEKLELDQSLKDELVLAIAEAAQNIVKHAYKDFPDTDDRMVVQISCKDNKLEIAFLITENQLKKKKLNTEQSTILSQVD